MFGAWWNLRHAMCLTPCWTSTEFHNLFEGKVDEEEHLVSDYACAWVKDVSEGFDNVYTNTAK